MTDQLKLPFDDQPYQFDSRFKIFHELMCHKVREVLLISSSYDAWVMEEDCRLSESIINEYRGLNLSHPPRLNWVATLNDALVALARKKFDLVIVMSRVADPHTYCTADAISKKAQDLPVVILCHMIPAETDFCTQQPVDNITRTFVWSGNTELLLAMIKITEDQLNVSQDVDLAGVRVIIYVEDSPEYKSALLPILYRELVCQTQEVMEEGLNEEHRLLAMRARPKIVIAQSYEQAQRLFQEFEANVLGLISDVRFLCEGQLDEEAGIKLLKCIKRKRFDIPLLLTSAESQNAAKAAEIPAVFLDKNSPELLSDVRSFFKKHLGFGDFVFRSPNGHEIGRATNLRELERRIAEIPNDSFVYHCNRNDFSRWLFARTEIELASKVRHIRDDDFANLDVHRRYLVSIIHSRRMDRQRGVVVNFDPKAFDVDSEFLKIGTGSLGGKARGLAFMSALLSRNKSLQEKFEKVEIFVPKTLVIATDVFEAFIQQNQLTSLAKEDLPDEVIAERFAAGDFEKGMEEQLTEYLSHIDYPLSVRSSSLLEDAQFRAYAGLYKTYLLANDHMDLNCRVKQLLDAVKMVFASTYFRGPKAFSRRVGHRTESDKMAVIIQQLIGQRYGSYFYPDISGVVQSYNYYPFSKMKPEDGIATIALGFGKTVMEGEKALRFSPKYPELLPQHSSVDEVLKNSQRSFYALKTSEPSYRLGVHDATTLVKRNIMEAGEEGPVKSLASTYIPEEHRIRDSVHVSGYRVMTFAPVLKYDMFPLADVLNEILSTGQEGMGCPVEMEFSLCLNFGLAKKPEFALLQIRPMSAREEMMSVDISEHDLSTAVIVSERAMGNTLHTYMTDIIYVKPDSFELAKTPEIARQIGKINGKLVKAGRRYLLIGPGRWGSADRWLGIPITWSDISGVGAIVETVHPQLNVEPSQGSHFFQNITALGIDYLTVTGKQRDRIDWQVIESILPSEETHYVVHIALDRTMTLKVDGRSSSGVVLLKS